MEAVTRRTLADLAEASDELLQQLTDADATTTELLRAETVRLASASFAIVRLLAHDCIAEAYRICVGDADQDSEVLGVAI